MRFLARLLLAAALIAPHQALALDPSKVPPVTLGIGSTGDVSNASVTVNGTPQSLQSWLPSLAPLASPTFTGTATVPKLSVTGSGSTGDVSAMSVTASGTTQALQSWLPTLAPLASPTFTGTAKVPTLSVTGSGSTGDVSGMSVTAGASTRTLATWFPLMAPLASPVFSGTVIAPVVNLSTLSLVPTNDYNDAGRTNTQIFGAVGTRDAPTTDKSAVGIWQKTSNASALGVNATTYTSHIKRGALAGNEASAVMGEGVDEAGGAQSSVIGGRFNGLLTGGALGSPIGVSGTATLGGSITSFQNAVGGEFAIQNLFVDAPDVYSQATMTAAVLAGNTGTKRSDAGFITNPFTTVPFLNGFLVTPNSVRDAAFRSLATTKYGLDLGSGSQSVAAIRTPNSLAQQAPTIDNRDSAPIVIPAGGSALLGAGAGGLFVVTNVTSQATAAFLGDAANSIALVAGSPSWVASTKTPASGQTSVAFDGTTGLRIYNGFSSSQSFKVTSITQR